MAQLYEDGSSKILSNLENCMKRNNLVIDRIENNLDVGKVINNLLERGIISQEDVKNLENKGIKIHNKETNKTNEIISREDDNSKENIDYDKEIEL